MKHEVLIITGMSGAGKTIVARSLEDNGYFCVDNLPPAILGQAIAVLKTELAEKQNIAIVIDLRAGKMFNTLEPNLKELSNAGIDYKIVFLDASDEVLIRRFKETRRKHPLATPGSSLLNDIAKERKNLEELRDLAKYIIDTSDHSATEIKSYLSKLFDETGKLPFVIQISSFGFKYGIPLDADLVIDVRFIPNPFYMSDLKLKTGLDSAVQKYVMQFPETQEFVDDYLNMLLKLLPHYIQEGKSFLGLAVGCTGGQHRSVTIAEELFKKLGIAGYAVNVQHRDMLNNQQKILRR
ncbi:MAG: RNase adapter RapZ [Clostridia bacterium]